MFNNVGRRVSKDSTQSTPAVEDEDDNISLASTASLKHDTDEEFEVEDILLEALGDDDIKMYLVKWERYPLDQCTWEPEDNLGDELISMWREKKRRQEAGEEEPFDVREFQAAQDKAKEEKADRHRRRNAKRRKLGLPLTEPFDNSSLESDLDIAKVESSDESSDEVLEQEEPVSKDDQELRSTKKSAPRLQAETKPKQRIFKGIAQPIPKSAKFTSTARQPKSLEPKPKTSSKANSEAPEKPSLPQPSSSKPRSERNFVSTTSYQGTARKPVNKPRPSTTNGLTRPLPQSIRTAPSIASRSTAAGVRKPLTAKRTAIKKNVSVNIFAEGKTRKPRKSLKEAMSDATEIPKQFTKHRYRRLAEKRSRDKEDIPPDLLAAKIQLFPIKEGPAGRKILAGPAASSSTSVPAPGGQTPRTQAETEAEASVGPDLSFDEPTPVSSQELSFRPKGRPRRKSSLAKPKSDGGQPKERKSVRFVPEDDETAIFHNPEEMDVSGLFVEQDHTTTTTPTNPTTHQRIPSPDPPPLTASADESDDGVPRGNLNKRLLIADVAPLEVTFHDVPRDNHQLWSAHFGKQKSLEFRLSCFAKTAVAQMKPPLFQRCLAKGAVTSENREAAEMLAQQLKTRLTGIFYSTRHYNLLIYPTKCEDWQVESLGQDVATGLTAALCYVIFSSDMDCGSMLRPLNLPPALPETNEDAVPTMALLMSRLYKFDYNQLLPRKPYIPKVHKFFLAFPESGTGKVTRSVIFQWLRSCNPDCHIYISSHPGSWGAFRASVAESSGVVIIHETLMWSLRRFPKLSEYLIKKYDEYWCFTEPSEAYPLYPSMSLPECRPPGISQLTRILPFRTAILLTPSFLVSEPERAREFLDWFFNRWNYGFYYRLVTASNIHEYLLDLALECIDSRERWWAEGPALRMSPIDIQLEINMRGHGREESECRLQASIIASELDRIRARTVDSSAGMEEDHSPLIYADPSIDPNDEQSLVNWFGWWSTLRADQFRKFHVVGSCHSIGYPNNKKGIRTVRIPKYLRTTINDPDAVAEVVQSEVSQNLQVPAHELPPSDPPSAAGSLGLNSPFKSDILRNDHGETIQEFLFSNFGNTYKVLFYGFPVTWADPDMAKAYGDFILKNNKAINDWFSYLHGFNTSKFNTYMGLFYTTPDEWDPHKPPTDLNPRWHPWLAIFRPVNPHWQPRNRCELIIWDPLANKRFPGSQAPLESELTDMQRRVVQYVRENCGKKGQGLYLDQVWLGGFNCLSGCESPYPLDMTLKVIRTMLRDLREHLPAPEKVWPHRGYRKVLKEHPPAPNPMNDGGLDSDDNVVMEVDSNAGWADKDEDVRIIFHPPRGTKLSPGYRSKCTNRLYEEAHLAKARSSSDRMEFKFVPTLQWYEDQVAEGRSFEHINIQSWQEIFNIFQIGKAKSNKVTTAAATAGARAPVATRGDREGDIRMTG